MGRILAVMIALPVLAALASSAEVAKSLPWNAPEARLAAGQDLYRENCAVCHDIEGKKRPPKLGPSLYHLFQNPRLPMSKGKPTRPYVIARIKMGGALMPAFGKWLDDEQIALLLGYVEAH